MDRLEAVDARDLDAAAGFAREQGYLWTPGLLAADDLRALGALVDAAWQEAPGDLLALQRSVLGRLELDRLRRDSGLLRVAAAILGPCEPGHGDVVRYVPPGAEPTPPHQDGSYVGVERPLWLAWIPLDDCPSDVGPLAVWPGSHKLGLLPHDGGGVASEAVGAAQWAAADLACGDALFVSSLTVHKALPNRSERPRRSVDFRYRPTATQGSLPVARS